VAVGAAAGAGKGRAPGPRARRAEPQHRSNLIWVRRARRHQRSRPSHPDGTRHRAARVVGDRARAPTRAGVADRHAPGRHAGRRRKQGRRRRPCRHPIHLPHLDSSNPRRRRLRRRLDKGGAGRFQKNLLATSAARGRRAGHLPISRPRQRNKEGSRARRSRFQKNLLATRAARGRRAGRLLISRPRQRNKEGSRARRRWPAEAGLVARISHQADPDIRICLSKQRISFFPAPCRIDRPSYSVFGPLWLCILADPP